MNQLITIPFATSKGFTLALVKKGPTELKLPKNAL